MIKRLLRLVGRWARKPVNHTSWVAVVTPTDRPKSVRNRCVIELFCGVVCVVTLPFWHFCWCRGFCQRTESDLFLFLFIARGFHRTFSIGAAYQQRTLTPLNTWSCPSLGLAYVLMLRQISPKLVLFLDFWVSNIPWDYYFTLLDSNFVATCAYWANVQTI